eukprot:TRINITY_DN15296_c0_g2_i1.p1 TRINITY_DN15296_c0_g2~~TRINITY_DN15296_c0_g2_i1.p1  ORF type:complete len:842 (+),score=266.74 TRINITY_DN15296_c0_g2_i1:38-2527(+)
MEDAIKNAEEAKVEHPIVGNLKSTYTEMVNQANLFEKMRKILKQKEYQLKALNDILAEAESMKLRDRSRKQEYLETLATLEMERDLLVNRRQTREKLEKSFVTENFALLSEALEDAQKFKLPPNELLKFNHLHSRLEKEINIYEELKQAVEMGMSTMKCVDAIETALSKTAEILKFSPEQESFISSVRRELLQFYRSNMNHFLDEKEEEQLQSFLVVVEKKGYAISLKTEISDCQRFLADQERMRKALARQKYIEVIGDQLIKYIKAQDEDMVKAQIAKISQEGIQTELAEPLNEAQSFLGLQERKRQEEIRRKLVQSQKDIFLKVRQTGDEDALKAFIRRVTIQEYASDLTAEIEEAQSIVQVLETERKERERLQLLNTLNSALQNFLQGEDEYFALDSVLAQVRHAALDEDMKESISKAEEHRSFLQKRRELISSRLSQLRAAISGGTILDIEESIENIQVDQISKFCEKEIGEGLHRIVEIRERCEQIGKSKTRLEDFLQSHLEDALREELKLVKQSGWVTELKEEVDNAELYLKAQEEHRHRISGYRRSFARRVESPGSLEEWIQRVQEDGDVKDELTSEIMTAGLLLDKWKQEEHELKTLREDFQQIHPNEDLKLAEWVSRVEERHYAPRLSSEVKRARGYIEAEVRRRAERQAEEERRRAEEERKQVAEEQTRVESNSKLDVQRKKLQELKELRVAEEKKKKKEEEEEKKRKKRESKAKRKESESPPPPPPPPLPSSAPASPVPTGELSTAQKVETAKRAALDELKKMSQLEEEMKDVPNMRTSLGDVGTRSMSKRQVKRTQSASAVPQQPQQHDKDKKCVIS